MNDEELRQWLAEKYPGRTVKRDGDELVITIPVNFHRRNGRQMVLAQNDSSGNQRCEYSPNHTLVANLAKAFKWQEQLESGEYDTLEDLAKANRVDRTHVGRIVKLASLSPTIVENILAGNETVSLSLRKLRKGFSPLWHEQV